MLSSPLSLIQAPKSGAVRVVRARLSVRASVAVAPSQSAAAGRAYSTLTVGVPKESGDSERRVSGTPESVRRLISAGFSVVVEAGLGVGSELSDAAYVAAGARIGSRAEVFGADVVTHVRPFTLDEVRSLKAGAVSISLVAPAQNKELVAALAAQGVTSLGLDCIPRMLSRAQAFDVLSSQAVRTPVSLARCSAVTDSRPSP